MYRWLVDEGMSLRGIAKKLNDRGAPTARSAAIWQPTAVGKIIRNPVYKGTFYYQRAESVMPSRRLSSDPYAKARKTGRKPRPEKDWIAIPVPPIVEGPAWEQAQQQLRQNSVYSPRNNRRHKYLLRSMVRCSLCGSTLSGQAVRDRRYYRCTNKHSTAALAGRPCTSRSVQADPLEDAVWEALSGALKQPEVLVERCYRQIEHLLSREGQAEEQQQHGRALQRVKTRQDRVIEAYIAEVMELDRYKAEMEKLKLKHQELERAASDLAKRTRRQEDARDALQYLDRFCRRVAVGLGALSFEERQRVLRLLVERITVVDGRVRVEAIIPTGDDSDQLRALRGEPVEPHAA